MIEDQQKRFSYNEAKDRRISSKIDIDVGSRMENNVEKVNSNTEQMLTTGQPNENNDNEKENEKDKVKQEPKLFDHKNKAQVFFFGKKINQLCFSLKIKIFKEICLMFL